MNKSLVLKNKFYLFLLLISSIFIFIYLSYFLLNGERGVISYFKIKNENNRYNIILSELKKTNDFYLDRSSRLKIGSMDLDYLDEKVKEKTGFLNKNELLIIFD